jgi:predicted O-linked N-acetylglucosamine transferase (SPINDLY family)
LSARRGFLYCYSDVRRPDAVTARIRKSAVVWRELRGLSDPQAADLIRRDQVDILVDLAGHTARNRLLVFARKPAPVQVTYLGYPDTTGLNTIDYRLTDAWADPPGQTERFHTEELVRLPRGAWCYRPPEDAPAVEDLPAWSAGSITFGCFNNFAKVTPRMIGAWADILRDVPGARIILKSPVLMESSTRRLALERFRAHGIEGARVGLFGPVEPEQHLAFYNWIDIALDTFPYHGTTTTCEALWMGVPVVVLAGATHASRVGVSLLASVGLADWAADSLEAYVERAVRAARELDRLRLLRAGLRERMAQSPLTDAKVLTRDLEAAYRRMWRRWCESP